MKIGNFLKRGGLVFSSVLSFAVAGGYYTNSTIATDPDVTFYSIDPSGNKVKIQSTTVNKTSSGEVVESLVTPDTITLETGKLKFAKAPGVKNVSLQDSRVLHRTYDTKNPTPYLQYTLGKTRVDRVVADMNDYPDGAYSNTGEQRVYVDGAGGVETYSINDRGVTNYFNKGTKSIYSFTNADSSILPSTDLCKNNDYKCIMGKYFVKTMDYYFEPYTLKFDIKQNIYIPPPLPVTYKKVFPVPGTFTWKVPDNIHSIRVVVAGGGGSGGSAAYARYGVAGGGYAGERKDQYYTAYKPGDVISIKVGKGGDSVYANKKRKSVNGNAGVSSSFGSVVSKGGKGGLASTNSENANPLNYPGKGGNAPGWGRSDGEEKNMVSDTSSTSTFGGWKKRGGISITYKAYAYGGQGERGGSGGDAQIYTGGGGGFAFAGGDGAGGGGIVGTGSSGDTSGKGGDGYVVLTYTVLEY